MYLSLQCIYICVYMHCKYFGNDSMVINEWFDHIAYDVELFISSVISSSLIIMSSSFSKSQLFAKFLAHISTYFQIMHKITSHPWKLAIPLLPETVSSAVKNWGYVSIKGLYLSKAPFEVWFCHSSTIYSDLFQRILWKHSSNTSFFLQADGAATGASFMA